MGEKINLHDIKYIKVPFNKRQSNCCYALREIKQTHTNMCFENIVKVSFLLILFCRGSNFIWNNMLGKQISQMKKHRLISFLQLHTNRVICFYRNHDDLRFQCHDIF